MQGRVYGLEGGVARADGGRAQCRRALRVRRIPTKHACELEPQPRQADKRLCSCSLLSLEQHTMASAYVPPSPRTLDRHSLIPLYFLQNQDELGRRRRRGWQVLSLSSSSSLLQLSPLTRPLLNRSRRGPPRQDRDDRTGRDHHHRRVEVQRRRKEGQGATPSSSSLLLFALYLSLSLWAMISASLGFGRKMPERVALAGVLEDGRKG